MIDRRMAIRVGFDKLSLGGLGGLALEITSAQPEPVEGHALKVGLDDA